MEFPFLPTVRPHLTSLHSPDSGRRTLSYACMHAPCTHTHTHGIPLLCIPPLPPSPFWGRRRVPAAPWNAPRSMPECQARRTTSERANTVPRRANYAKYADERGGCDGGGGGARGNINMPPFTPHTLTTLFPPTSPSFLPSFPPSLPHLHAAARLGHAHIWEEGKEGRGEEKKGMRARRRQEARGREEKRMSSANAPDDRKRGRESERAGLRRRAVRLGHARECDGCFSASAVYRRHRCRRRRRRPHVPGHPSCPASRGFIPFSAGPSKDETAATTTTMVGRADTTSEGASEGWMDG